MMAAVGNWALLGLAASWVVQQYQDLLAAQHYLGHIEEAYFSSSQSQCESSIQLPNAAE